MEFTDIARNLIDDTQRMIHDEVALAKAEVHESIEKTHQSAAAMAAGSVFALVRFVYPAMAMVVLLSKVMSALKATLLVSGGLMTLGGARVWQGKNTISGLNIMPERTVRTLKEDQAWLKDRMKKNKTSK